MSAEGYAGDKSPKEAWDILKNDRDSVLVDVRTNAEWTFVGAPDLSAIDKEVCFAAWVNFPDMAPNPDFMAAVEKHGPGKDAPVLLLCRSGQRSIAAARALTERGYTACYNVLDGFEGDKTADNRRGQSGGWKVAGLPWRQG